MVNFTGFLSEDSSSISNNVWNSDLYIRWTKKPSWGRRWDENWAGEFNQFSGWGTNWNKDFGRTRSGYRIPSAELHHGYVSESADLFGVYTFVDAANREFNFAGYIGSSYFDIFYNRILIEPIYIDFGNILSTQSVAIEIFNAYLENVTLQTLTLDNFDEGTSYTDIPTPSDLLPLEERTTYVTATTSGDPQIDANIIFNFGAAGIITVSIVGSRIVLFPVFFRDDIKEELVWATNVMNSYNGTEQRRKIRNQPRQRLNITAHLNYDDRNRLDNLIWGWRKRIWAIPMWIEAKQADTVNAGESVIYLDTRFADFRVDGLAVIFESAAKFDVFQITDITDTTLTANREIAKTFVNPIVMPVRSARMLSDPIRSTSGHDGSIQARFEVTDNIAFSVDPTTQQFDGIDTFFEQQLGPGGGDTVDDSYEHRVDVLDFTTGIVQSVSPWTYTRVNRTFELVFEGPEEVWNLRQWLHRRFGRLVPFYGSNSEDAFRILSEGTILGVFTAYNNDYANQASTRDHLAVHLTNGTVQIVTITNSGVSLDGERIDITFEPELNVDISEIESVQTLTYKRLSSDAITLHWLADHKVFVEIPTTELKP